MSHSKSPGLGILPDREVSLVDLGFMDARSKLIDLAAYLDRVQRVGQDNDYRVLALKNALLHLTHEEPNRAQKVLLTFSDPTTEPIPVATIQSAAGAWNEKAASQPLSSSN